MARAELGKETAQHTGPFLPSAQSPGLPHMALTPGSLTAYRTLSFFSSALRERFWSSPGQGPALGSPDLHIPSHHPPSTPGRPAGR